MKTLPVAEWAYLEVRSRVRAEKEQNYQGKVKQRPVWCLLLPYSPAHWARPALAGIVVIGDKAGSQERHLISNLKAKDSQKLEVKGGERKRNTQVFQTRTVENSLLPGKLPGLVLAAWACTGDQGLVPFVTKWPWESYFHFDRQVFYLQSKESWIRWPLRQ